MWVGFSVPVRLFAAALGVALLQTAASVMPECTTSVFGQRPKVALLLRVLSDYRIAVFERLRQRLCAAGIDFEVIYSAREDEFRAASAAPSEWMRQVPDRVLRMRSKPFRWQAILEPTRQHDLVIIGFWMRQVSNYALVGRRRPARQRVAAWGHGRNLQSDEASFDRFIRTQFLRRLDWFFAYNELSADLVADMGYPRTRITALDNTIDTASLAEARGALKPEAARQVRESLGLQGKRVGIFCGSLYPKKRLGFLAAACRLVRRQLDDFELIIVGDGVDRSFVERIATSEDWIHYAGRQEGAERVPYFEAAQVTLMPGLVGLGIVDAFVLGCPPVATRYPYHSPEIAYLEHEGTGFWQTTHHRHSLTRLSGR